MPGIMSKMPPLPVSVNENLASFVLPGLTVVSTQGPVTIRHTVWKFCFTC
jgi:hypothetical protein